MRRTQWEYLFLAGIFSLAFLSATAYASSSTTTAQAATEARHQPVVAPVPSGPSAADPAVANSSPSDDVSTAPVVSSTTISQEKR